MKATALKTWAELEDDVRAWTDDAVADTSYRIAQQLDHYERTGYPVPGTPEWDEALAVIGGER